MVFETVFWGTSLYKCHPTFVTDAAQAGSQHSSMAAKRAVLYMYSTAETTHVSDHPHVQDLRENCQYSITGLLSMHFILHSDPKSKLGDREKLRTRNSERNN
jgi:hypothetical protein